MDSKRFEGLLKKAKLTRKEFAEMNELHQNSVTNWNSKGFPGWVGPCLINYIKAKQYDKMIDAVRDADSDYKVQG